MGPLLFVTNRRLVAIESTFVVFVKEKTYLTIKKRASLFVNNLTSLDGY